MNTRKKPTPAATVRKTTTRRKRAAPKTAAKPKAAPATPAKVRAAATAAAKVAKPAKEEKGKKSKTVRDSFNMPEHDYALIGVLKKRAQTATLEIKKSELLRAGLKILSRLPEADFLAALAAVDPVKTGRPKKKK
ncbi:MAG: hypothetical protein JNK75_03280 [Betaproteobacteria bacterium]|nr:hypothetical protein [Betaproteobacteria bacterium]